MLLANIYEFAQTQLLWLMAQSWKLNRSTPTVEHSSRRLLHIWAKLSWNAIRENLPRAKKTNNFYWLPISIGLFDLLCFSTMVFSCEDWASSLSCFLDQAFMLTLIQSCNLQRLWCLILYVEWFRQKFYLLYQGFDPAVTYKSSHSCR